MFRIIACRSFGRAALLLHHNVPNGNATTTLTAAKANLLVCRWSSHDLSATGIEKRPRPDPTAKRPNRVCDPYGQKGNPLSFEEAKSLCSTIHSDWRLESRFAENKDTGTVNLDGASTKFFPVYLSREFMHPDFVIGAQFLAKLAAVAQVNAHFPTLHLERRIVNQSWITVSYVKCHTTVLGGLATHDFYVAMVRFMMNLTKMSRTRSPCLRYFVFSLLAFSNAYLGFRQLIDVEVARPELRKMLLDQ